MEIVVLSNVKYFYARSFRVNDNEALLWKWTSQCFLSPDLNLLPLLLLLYLIYFTASIQCDARDVLGLE